MLCDATFCTSANIIYQQQQQLGLPEAEQPLARAGNTVQYVMAHSMPKHLARTQVTQHQ
jgi:hypothetical protein